MAKKLLYVLLILFVSCSANKKVIGTYYKKGEDFKYSLKLNKDHTFLLKDEGFECTSECQGKWNYLQKDTLLLECERADLDEMLQGCYMSNRIRKVIILNHHHVKLGQEILTKEMDLQ